MENFLDRLGRILLVLGVHIAADIKEEVLVILQFKAFEREMLGIEGVAGLLGDLHGQLGHVENLGTGSGYRVHQPVAGAVGILPGIPEFIGITEPVRTHLGGEDHLVHLLGGKTLRQFVIRGLGRQGEKGRGTQQKGKGQTLHCFVNSSAKIRFFSRIFKCSAL